MAKRQDISVTPSSGNVFADIGVTEPGEELAKAQLARLIRQTVRGRRLTRAAAGKAMGMDRHKVSALLNGRLRNFSSERLIRLLTRLGHDVEIVLGTRSSRRHCGQIRVVEAARP